MLRLGVCGFVASFNGWFCVWFAIAVCFVISLAGAGVVLVCFAGLIWKLELVMFWLLASGSWCVCFALCGLWVDCELVFLAW